MCRFFSCYNLQLLDKVPGAWCHVRSYFELKISAKRLIFARNTVVLKRKWSFYCVKWWNSVISKLLILFWRNWFRQVKQIQVSPSPKKSFQWHQSKPIMRFGPFLLFSKCDNTNTFFGIIPDHSILIIKLWSTTLPKFREYGNWINKTC